MLETIKLGYQYDNLSLPGIQRKTPSRPKETETVAPISLKSFSIESINSPIAIAAKRELTLSGNSKTISFQIEKATAGRIDALSFDKGESSKAIRVVLENVKLTDVGKKVRALYRVYLNLPSEGSAQTDTPHFLGQIDAFALSSDAHGGAHQGDPLGRRFEFELDPLVKDLVARKAWDPSQLNVSFVAGTDFKTSEPLISIGNIRIELLPALNRNSR
jgi:tyrosinase